MRKYILIIIATLVFVVIGLEILIPNILGIPSISHLISKKLIPKEEPQVLQQDDPLLADFTVNVVNAITENPVVGAEVRVKKMVVCLGVIGAECPESDILVNETNENGVAKFDTRPLGGNSSLYITVNASGYQQETAENTDIDREGKVIILDKVAVKLVGGKISVASETEAKEIASTVEKVRAWLAESSEGIVTSARLESKVWIVEFATKRNCNRAIPEFRTDRPCILNVYIAPETGEILNVEEK